MVRKKLKFFAGVNTVEDGVEVVLQRRHAFVQRSGCRKLLGVLEKNLVDEGSRLGLLLENQRRDEKEENFMNRKASRKRRRRRRSGEEGHTPAGS